VGGALEVPTETAASEVHVIIEGKLRELGGEPNNVQVFVSNSGMSLLDEGVSIPVESEQPREDSIEPEDRGSIHD